MRLAPYIASRSNLSRRQAEKAIIEGRVCVDGVLCHDFCAQPKESISLDDRVLGHPPAPCLCVAYLCA